MIGKRSWQSVEFTKHERKSEQTKHATFAFFFSFFVFRGREIRSEIIAEIAGSTNLIIECGYKT